MNGSRLALVTFITGLALGAPDAMGADPPELVSYQGVLRSADGEPLDGTYDLIFRFTDSPVGGTLLLTDYHTGPSAVVVDGGLFTALLGGGTLAPGTESSLEGVFARYSPVYFEVQVGAETLAPRVQVVSTGFALNAGRFGGQLPDGFLDTSAENQVKEGALTSNTGVVVLSESPTGAVEAVDATTFSTSGIGVLGSALADSGPTEGVRGQTTSPDGRGVVGIAFSGSGVAVGVLGEAQSPDGTGVHGRATAGNGATVGVAGEIFSDLGTAIVGVSHATSGEGWGVYGQTASADGYGVVSIGDSITSGDVYATGTKYFLTEHPSAADHAIRFACLEGGEVGVYHRGDGRLDRGEARIVLPEPFPLVATGRVTVQVTPLEEAGGLYVPSDEIGTDGFTVREAGDSRSNAAFSYVVMAERAGYENEDPVRPISVADKIVTSTRLSPAQKAALRTALSARTHGAIEDEKRSALYASLHEGDYDGSCRLLGGCDGAGRDVSDRGAGESPENRRNAVQRTSGAAPERSSAGWPASGVRELGAGPAAPDSRTPPTPQPAVHPSSLAMLHTVTEAVAPGDLVVMDPSSPSKLRPGREASDPRVVGVVAFIDEPVPAGGKAPVAYVGIVPCRVDAAYGWIRPGDLLVASPTPGHAMRADDPAPGTVIGKAMGSLDVGQGAISVLLMPR